MLCTAGTARLLYTKTRVNNNATASTVVHAWGLESEAAQVRDALLAAWRRVPSGADSILLLRGFHPAASCGSCSSQLQRVVRIHPCKCMGCVGIDMAVVGHRGVGRLRIVRGLFHGVCVLRRHELEESWASSGVAPAGPATPAGETAGSSPGGHGSKKRCDRQGGREGGRV